ncbi:MAG: glycosyltransferase, partial [Catalinimonas sp.]
RLPRVLTWRSLARGLAVGHQSIVVRRASAPHYDHRRHYYSADVEWMVAVLKAARATAPVEGPLTRFLLGGFSKQHHRRSLIDRFQALRRHFGLLPTLWNHASIVARAVRFRLGRRSGGL